MLKRHVEREISVYKVEHKISEVKVKLKKVALKVDTGMNGADPTEGDTTKLNSDSNCEVTG